MQTGEGKTLTAILPIAVRAMAGKGCHVLTSNDYLAKRDAEFAAPILEQLGLSVGYIQTEMEDSERADAYRRDVTYGTGAEMGFDFLRDRLRSGPRVAAADQLFQRSFTTTSVQRGHFFALVDEADHLLIDDAVTPLLIALETEEPESRVAMYAWANEVAVGLEPDTHFELDPERKDAFLTQQGMQRVALKGKPRSMNSNSLEDIFEQVETSLIAHWAYARDRDYIVADGEVTIISESTGRQLTGRKWQRGLHFAVEAKEDVPFGQATGTAARVSVQSYFGLYQNLAGMTGTAWNARREFRKYYRSKTTVIPTNKPCIRRGFPTCIFVDMDSKNKFIVSEIRQMIARQRAVLVGTPSVEASLSLSQLLTSCSVVHVVLNAVHHEQEAEIVAEAGTVARVTIATNMAGRGTDIMLDENVRRAGGLHVIATEMHTARRIDRQLIGRAARQGDPGTYRFCLSLDDELLRHAPALQAKLKAKASRRTTSELPASWKRYFRRVQNSVEKLNHRARRLSFDSEKHHRQRAAKAGLDYYLEMILDE